MTKLKLMFYKKKLVPKREMRKWLIRMNICLGVSPTVPTRMTMTTFRMIIIQKKRRNHKIVKKNHLVFRFRFCRILIRVLRRKLKF